MCNIDFDLSLAQRLLQSGGANKLTLLLGGGGGGVDYLQSSSSAANLIGPSSSDGQGSQGELNHHYCLAWFTEQPFDPY